MGLFLHKCYQICHLSLLARFRQHIKHSSVWPAVCFPCVPSLPGPWAHTWKNTSRIQAISPPLRVGRAGQHLPLPPPCPQRRIGRRGTGGAFPEDRGCAATCRPPRRGPRTRAGTGGNRGGTVWGAGWPGCCSACSPRWCAGAGWARREGGRLRSWLAVAMAPCPGHSRWCKTSPAKGRKHPQFLYKTRSFFNAVHPTT